MIEIYTDKLPVLLISEGSLRLAPIMMICNQVCGW